ncbi:hypothetical protein NYE48_27965 [Paenibacillus sp. FSL M7-1455]|uniref:hypothetical protein n=1 Tax=Paenibacillus sp. FSL M7-1455 TaxID=2975316 RepID=UPI0030FB4B6B
MSMKEAIRLAYQKGYRVMDDGTLMGLKGKPLVVRKRGKQGYPTFSVNCGDLTPSGIYGIPVHKFAAYCFYGESTFCEGIVVRHLNANTEDVSKENIKLGTGADNEADKSPEDKSRVARIARAAQGFRALNAKFSDEEVVAIRARFASGESGASIALSLGVTRNCIYLIVKGVNYRDVA